MTPAVQRNMEAVVVALLRANPVLLEGPPGCGKTALIKELAAMTGNTDAVYIHMDDQTDSKTLLGTYVCSEVWVLDLELLVWSASMRMRS